MKKTLRVVLSMLLVASVALTASAVNPEVASKKGGELVDAKHEALTQRATAAPTGDQLKSDFQMPQVRTHSPLQQNVFRSAPSGPVRIKAPMAAPYAPASVPEIQGCVIYSDDWSSTANYGLYQVPTAAGQEFTLKFKTVAANYGGVVYDGVYYAHNYESILGILQYFTVTGYDMETGEAVYSKTVTPAEMAPSGLALDPTTNTVYGIFYTAAANGYRLGSIEYTEAGPVVTEIAPMEGTWRAFAIDGNGQFYGIKSDTDGAYLCKISRSNGEVTVVGLTGMEPNYISGMAFDTKYNRLFWTVNPADETGFLTEIDVNTGVATKIYDFPGNDEVCGLYIPVPPEAGAPAAVTDLKLDYPKGTLEGTISFKAPATTYSGDAGEGDINYEVLMNDESVATGTAAYGEAVSIPYTVPEAATYKVVVSVSNEVGNGPVTKLTQYIGMGVPKTPVVTLVYEDGDMKVSWTTVSETVDGGYIDPEAITYDVVRYPGEVHLGTLGHLVNSTSESIAKTEDMIFYYYTVVANNGNTKSAAGKSNVVALGDAVTPPFAETFDTASSLSIFNVIDGNEDGKVWTWYNGEVRMQYNSSKDMDDWLILPALRLQGKTLYKFSVAAHANGSYYPERIEVMMGTSPASMTQMLVAPTVLNSSTPEILTANIVPAEDGIYYVGIHGISDADQFYLYVDDINISEAMSAAIPGPVTDLAIVPGANGALYGNLKFTTPAKLLNGDAISKIDKVEVYDEDEDVLYSGGPIAGGAEMACPVTVPTDGTYTFTVKTFVGDAESETASVSEYIGIDYPEMPVNVEMAEEGNTGKVTLTWDAVTKDVRGSDLPEVTYEVYTIDGGYLGDKLATVTTPSYTYQAVPAGEQDLLQLGVRAVSRRGVGSAVGGPMEFVGTPYPGYLETFVDGGLSHDLMIRTLAGQPSWTLMQDSSGVPSQDGDNGFIAMKATYLYDSGALYFGKVSLANMDKPGMTFFTYNLDLTGGDDTNLFEVYVTDLSVANSRTLVYDNDVNSTGPKNRWNRIYIDLAEYAGKNIYVELVVTCYSAVYTMFDNIFIGNMTENDLAVSLDAPATVAPETEFKVVATVANEGVKAAGAYTLKLKANNVVIATKTADELAFDGEVAYEFPYTFSVVDEDPVEFVAELIYNDEVANNNVSATVKVTPKLNKYPVPVDLVGEVTPEGVKLTWDEPVIVAGTPETVTDDVENGESFAHEYAGWTFVDGDGSEVGGFQGTDIPGIEPGETKASFFVFDGAIMAGSQYEASYAAHSGTKYLAALFRYDDGTTDDWAISPSLSGSAQTISFYAKSYSSSYPEKIEILYSTGSLDPDEFVLVSTIATVPNDWTLYTADLPEGAMYFAIHSCATGSFMLMLDDLTYETMDANADLSLVGYNIYRNAQKVNDEPDSECEYLDVPEAAQNLEYVVTAVYTKGESKPSNSVVISASGLDQVLAGVEIVAEAGQIIVTGAEGQMVSVVAVDGKVVFAAVGEAKTVATVAPGVYVVKAGTKVVKVLVK